MVYETRRNSEDVVYRKGGERMGACHVTALGHGSRRANPDNIRKSCASLLVAVAFHTATSALSSSQGRTRRINFKFSLTVVLHIFIF